ncbi:MAG: DUF29 domain-containing protein [Acidobacteriota bacterium]|nr:DUF29 domain-containing protein [Acidobacteriota bacterium]
MRTYEQDYAGWAQDTAKAIEEGRWAEIDRAALADEVLDVSKSDRRAIVGMFEVLLVHLLKRRYQPDRETRSWEYSIAVQRLHLAERFEESPSLRAQATALLRTAYKAARLEAANDTGLDVTTFPETCEWMIDEVLGS